MYTAYLKGSLALTSGGEWTHNGKPFENRTIIELFSRSIVWDETDREYYIQIGAQRAQFDCEDCAYFVLGIDEAASPWRVELSDGSSEPLRPETLWLGNQNQIYCLVHGMHRARFGRAAHQRLVAYAQDEETLLIDARPQRLPQTPPPGQIPSQDVGKEKSPV